MKPLKWLVLSLLLTVTALAGCARAARDTQGFAVVSTAQVDAPFDATWQATKAVLRERELDIYTRDKRGVFVAFTPMKRNLFLVPKRTQYTISLEAQGEHTTSISVRTISQVYGVTVLTYPGWHDRKTTDDTGAVAIIDAVRAKATGQA